MPLWDANCQCYSACRCCCVCAANPDMAEELAHNPTSDPNPSAGTTPTGRDGNGRQRRSHGFRLTAVSTAPYGLS